MWRSFSRIAPVQRIISDTPVPGPKKPPSTTEEIQAAIDAQDKGMIHDIHDFSKATETQKMAQQHPEPADRFFDENAEPHLPAGAGIWNLVGLGGISIRR
jgi:hypothetical protein